MRHFEDFTQGETLVGPAVVFTAGTIVDFARLYDPQPHHLDPKAAEAGLFGGLVASGFQTLAQTFAAFFTGGPFDGSNLGSPGIESLEWLKPVRPGDAIHLEGTVAALRPSASKPDRGLITMDYRAVDGEGHPVMRYRMVHLVRRRS